MFQKEFYSSHVGFMKDGARWLVDNTDVKLLVEIYEMMVAPGQVEHGIRRIKTEHRSCLRGME
ncbi:Cyclase family protein [Prunus dulcis]|nr:Cyclase family protein [Prunus dulcis]